MSLYKVIDIEGIEKHFSFFYSKKFSSTNNKTIEFLLSYSYIVLFTLFFSSFISMTKKTCSGFKTVSFCVQKIFLTTKHYMYLELPTDL